MQNFFLNWLAGMVGGRLDKYKRKIGGVALLLAATCQVLMTFFPDLQIEGMSQVDWNKTFEMFRDGLAALGGTFTTVGVVHAAYKEGLKQPCPPELCPPIGGAELDVRLKEPDALGDGGLGVEVKDKWEGKPPSGSFTP